MENARFLCYMTDCYGPLSGVSWLCVSEQVIRQRAGLTTTVLNSEFHEVWVHLTLSVLVLWSTCPTIHTQMHPHHIHIQVHIHNEIYPLLDIVTNIFLLSILLNVSFGVHRVFSCVPLSSLSVC